MTLENVNKKRLVIRVVLLALIVAFGFLLFYIGKQHEVLLDNKEVEIAGKSYKAPEYMVVTINGDEEKSMEFYPDDRDVVKLDGPTHSIKVAVVNEDTEEVIKTVERSFNFGRTSALMISLPALLEGAPDVYLPLPGTGDSAADDAEQEAPAGGTEAPAAGTETPVDTSAPAAPAIGD